MHSPRSTPSTRLAAALLFSLSCTGGPPADGGTAFTDGGGTTDSGGTESTQTKGVWDGPCVFDLDCGGACPTLAEAYEQCERQGAYDLWVQECEGFTRLVCYGDLWGNEFRWVDGELACWSRSTDSREFCNYTSWDVQYGECPGSTATCVDVEYPLKKTEGD